MLTLYVEDAITGAYDTSGLYPIDGLIYQAIPLGRQTSPTRPHDMLRLALGALAAAEPPPPPRMTPHCGCALGALGHARGISLERLRNMAAAGPDNLLDVLDAHIALPYAFDWGFLLMTARMQDSPYADDPFATLQAIHAFNAGLTMRARTDGLDPALFARYRRPLPPEAPDAAL